MSAKPVPRPDLDSSAYFEAARHGSLLIQRCQTCARFVFPPRTACPTCLSSHTLEWREATGRGYVSSYCVVYRPHHPSFYDEVPIVFAAVAMNEGPIMLSEIRRVLPNRVSIGLPVRAEFLQLDGSIFIPVWVPAVQVVGRQPDITEADAVARGGTTRPADSGIR